MNHVIEYRQYAEQCRAMASSARNRLRRTQFLVLANQWEAIARHREKLLAAERRARRPVSAAAEDSAAFAQQASKGS